MPDVLVVEDDFALGEFVRRALERDGIPFRLAQDGGEALSLAAERWPAVVLLDLTLPGTLDGWQVWDALLAQAGGQTLRVILFAAELDSHDRQQAHRRAAWAVLRKPVSRVQLVDRVRRALAESSTHG
ncbi:MAG: response regulator [Anaerolineales bacterium]|nr:response regulator [Anaerolineales bacterium]